MVRYPINLSYNTHILISISYLNTILPVDQPVEAFGSVLMNNFWALVQRRVPVARTRTTGRKEETRMMI